MKPIIHVLTGPTAVGKTEWALRWAEARGAEHLLTAIAAGPYVMFQDEWHSRDGSESIPLGILARASLAEYVDHEEIFKITKLHKVFALYETLDEAVESLGGRLEVEAAPVETVVPGFGVESDDRG